jgi:hypothetical protein
MAGFEVVVRPAVLPNIRPAPPRVLAPADDPEQGKAEIGGGGLSTISESYSYSSSVSRNKPTEVKRRVDVTRIYQKGNTSSLPPPAPGGRQGDNTSGAVNKKNFVDVEVANKIWMTGRDDETYYYERIKAADNIEIMRKDVIKTGGEEV